MVSTSCEGLDGDGLTSTLVVEHGGSVDLATSDDSLDNVGIVVVSENELDSDNSCHLVFSAVSSRTVVVSNFTHVDVDLGDVVVKVSGRARLGSVGEVVSAAVTLQVTVGGAGNLVVVTVPKLHTVEGSNLGVSAKSDCVGAAPAHLSEPCVKLRVSGL